MQKLMLPDYANTDKGCISRQFRLTPTVQSFPFFIIFACHISGKSQGDHATSMILGLWIRLTMLTGRYSRKFVLKRQNRCQNRIALKSYREGPRPLD